MHGEPPAWCLAPEGAPEMPAAVAINVSTIRDNTGHQLG